MDSHSLIFQVFHALPEMTGPRGEPVGAIYGFVRDIVQLIETEKPDALLCAFDLSGPTFRHELYSDYKLDRGEMPADLALQIPRIEELMGAMGIPVISREGFEADDVLATVARLADEAGARCLIVTGDKDCRQLITEHVAVYNIRKQEVYDAKALAADWGVRPDQVVDFQALVGDKIDNVPGVPLIGPKLARELLEKYETLDRVLDHAEEVAGAKRRQNLIEYRDQALLSRQLVRLDTRVPIEPDWEACRLGGFDDELLASLMQEFGFRSLADKVLSMNPSGARFRPEAVESTYTLVDTPEKFAAFLEELRQQDLIAIDTETTDIEPRRAEIVGYAISWEEATGYYLPVRGPEGDAVLDETATADALRPILEDPAVAKVGQNLKYDIVVLRGAGIELQGVEFDTMVASYLLDAGERSHNLDVLSRKYLGHETIKIDELIGKGKNQKRMDEVPVAAVAPYAGEDADLTLRLRAPLLERLEEEGLEQLNSELEAPLVPVLADLEWTGISVDTDRLAELSRDFTGKLEALAAEIEELAGHPLNIGSPKQLARVLFEELGLPVVKRTKTGPSTDAAVLEELAPMHPLPEKIVEYRQYSKLLSTYVDALPTMLHPGTGRIHASFNQVVAATGRLSSSGPNLQNIPVRTAEGRQIRSAFRAAPEGWKLLAADYSQIELRVLAHFSGDETLREAFQNGEDIHTTVAAKVAGVDPSEVTADMRRNAKAVNFGIIYGQSPFGLSKALGISQDEAALFIESYFANYPGVVEFLTRTLDECRQVGRVETLLGRRRAISGVRPVEAGMRDPKTGGLRQMNLPERTAVNTVIQGSAADLIKVAMLRLSRRLKEERFESRMLLQIHDELVFEAPADSIGGLAAVVVAEMESAAELDVPLQVDVKTGDTWDDCEPWTEGG
ncbi:MAG: DNA polymerase I [Planctomycetota bacterium]